HNLAAVGSVGEVSTAVLPPGEAIHAGFWRRCAAYVIDGFIVGIAGWIVCAILLFGLAASGGLAAVLAGMVLNYLVLLAIYWLYFALQESSAAQATLGKRAMGIKVTDEHAHRIGFGRASGRFFGKILSALIANIGFLLAGFTERKQALHDMIASTFVVFGDVKPNQPLPAVRPPMPWYGWAVNIIMFSLAPLAIIAAIALPAYQEFGARAQAANGMVAADAAKTAVVEFYAAQNRCPDSNSEANFAASGVGQPYVSDVSIQPECRIVVTFAGSSAVNSPLRGQSIEMAATPDASGALEWTCSGSAPDRYLPTSCRQQ
ncbi:MAG TPA: RDD family protein, partial [Rhodanobacteraceae bacterium]|nr:RDD family protein [Rhodanobacteraceae bacterium]